MPDRRTPCEAVLDLLSPELKRQIDGVAAGQTSFWSRLSEIRLRAGRLASLTVDGRNLPLGVAVSREELERLLRRLCEGSVYAYGDSLREGYVTYKGCRVGIAGKAVLDSGQVVGIDGATSLVFRIPHQIEGAGRPLLDAWRRTEGRVGILVYSLPGVGKTTMLRDFALSLSSGIAARRVAVVDTRGELAVGYGGRGCLLDVLEGYPKAEGIEIATRVLSPEAVVCDEIGGYEEAESILSVQSCGVPLVASIHGDSIAALMERSTVKMLVECGIFGAFVGIRRREGGFAYAVDTV